MRIFNCVAVALILIVRHRKRFLNTYRIEYGIILLCNGIYRATLDAAVPPKIRNFSLHAATRPVYPSVPT